MKKQKGPTHTTMLTQEITRQVLAEFPFAPTAEQARAVATLAAFLADPDPRAVMILRGSAGTGKTALAGAIVRALARLRRRVLLLAPTGRAAKVFARTSGHEAFTIHRRIYREKAFTGVGGEFRLNDNLYRNVLFMVDESSMIGMAAEGSPFGSGRLLDDLVSYVYQGSGDRLLLIGDRAQLPPVGEEASPALSDEVMAGYGLKVWSADLAEVLRQASGSGILYNATVVRDMLLRADTGGLPRIRFHGFADIARVTGDELIEALSASYSEVGVDETMVITRSNKRAHAYNQGIRNTVLDRDDIISGGDMLMVVKNNYYWTEKDAADWEAGKDGASGHDDGHDDGSSARLAFIANGDRAEVMRVSNSREFYGFHFADAWLRFPDYDDYEMEATIMLDSLVSEAPALTREQNEALFRGVEEDYADVPLKRDRMARIRQDAYFNALQVKFAYAITCHKAQGGQWSHVYVDQGYMTADMLTPDYLHWLYTALTRATDKLFLVNWPGGQTDGEEGD